ncbi:uncharacterized protein LOC142227952 [Haematobia irritans]|uniref:uncharacterized protein LOC142227952 n=1 Tax=Haematobia irritans TaxID=7368 RepID=UPI003F4FD3DC
MGNDDTTNAELTALKSQRSTMKRNITNVKTKIEKDGDVVDETILECRLQILESYFKQICHIQSQIEKLNSSDSARSEIEELFISAKAAILKRLNTNRRSSNLDQSLLNVTQNHTAHQSRLPQLKLPKFDGKYSEFSRFISTFDKLVHEDSSVPVIDKFNYLLNCLSGQALAVIEPFPVTEGNYERAINRLKERYDNKSLIFIDTINSLFAISSISKPSATGLRSILDNVAAIRSSLLSIGSEQDVLNAIIIHIVLSKIDPESKTVYNEKQNLQKLPSWDECYAILSRRCQFLETAQPCYSDSNHSEYKHKPKDRRPATAYVTSHALCEYCQSQEHFISNCSSYLALPIPHRFDFVKTASLCINCLRKGHRVAACMSKSRCRECRVSHHSTLHNNFSQATAAPNTSSKLSSHPLSSTASSFTPSSLQPSTSQQAQQSSSSYNTSSVNVTTSLSLPTRSFRHSLLPTAIVLMKDKLGSWQPVRALLDSCSEINLITQDTVNRLNLPLMKAIQEIAGVSNNRTRIKYTTEAFIKSRVTEFKWSSCFLVINAISYQHPVEKLNIGSWPIPEGILLADPHFYIPQRIDILIGSEIFFDLLVEGKIILGSGLPSLKNTVFGWVVGGVVDSNAVEQVSSCNVVTKIDDLDSLLKRFWEIEEFTESKSAMTEEEEQCERHYLENTIFDENGRIQVRLPFKQPSDKLGSSYEIAHRRFCYLEKRLEKNPEHKKMYREFMNEYISLGHMSIVSFDELRDKHYVIPHHSVFRLQSTSTKLRVVFDASAKTSSNFSLNEILMVGPTIQQEIIITMLAFRLNKFAMCADICKMYRQFMVDQRDRKFQLVLWRDDDSNALNLYQLNTVTYGTSAAPFLAIRSLIFIADTFRDLFPIGTEVLRHDVYVDDILTGAENIPDLLRKKEEIIEVLGRACLSLSKWNSNCNQISAQMDDIFLKTDNEYISKTLGLIWKSKSDVFSFQFDLENPKIITKRSILSAVSKIYDVLGLISPITVSYKILIQELWKQNFDWDCPVNEHMANRWNQLRESLSYLNQLEIPRFVLTSTEQEFQIHGFADASLVAYGCCIYVRAFEDNRYKSNLLISKSKVAPVVQQSLPRLELCAALLLSKTWEKIRHKFDKYNYKIFFWSDSKIVLSWLKKHSSSFVCFVANRVSEIQNITHKITWRHVPSKQNPADIVSRGCLANELADTIWFEGPNFLRQCENEWPNNNAQNIELPLNEMRKTVLNIACVPPSAILEIINRQSSYLRILYTIVYIYRVFNKENRGKVISSAELDQAFWRIVNEIQQSTYSEEIQRIKKNEVLKPCFQKLTPFIEEKNIFNNSREIIRVGGRLANAPLSYDTKFPALLPKDHRFSQLFIEYLHRKHYHAGPKCLIGILRERVWVINAREIARKVVRNCVHCFKYKPRLQQQIMGDLPADRFIAHRPFLICGVDFCGPFYTSYRIRGKAPYKTYVALFVCFASKALHIEVVSDLSTNAFLLCLKRFVGRRGIPLKIYCDNATNFVGANNQLKEFKEKYFDKENTNSLMQYCAITGFQFSFIPPRSPHFGGLWEAAVKSTKILLVKNISQAHLTLEELQTVLVEVESILNSRPIAAKSDDPNDGEALTPAHMIIGSSFLSLPEESFEHHLNCNYLKRYQMVAFLKQQFWRLWSRDYVLSLQEKSKWYKSESNLKIGSLVIVHEDNTPPQRWILARVIQLFPGRDGKVRVVEVKTKNGILKRAVHKIAVLPSGEYD